MGQTGKCRAYMAVFRSQSSRDTSLSGSLGNVPIGAKGIASRYSSLCHRLGQPLGFSRLAPVCPYACRLRPISLQ